MSPKSRPASAIRLLVSDIDRALVTPDKVITSLARAAARALEGAGVSFSVVFARPPDRAVKAPRRDDRLALAGGGSPPEWSLSGGPKEPAWKEFEDDV
jgi:hypothetical protein